VLQVGGRPCYAAWLIMGRKRKSGARTKSGRLSRAYAGPARDPGSPESILKRAALINGSDCQLAASASGILLANGYLTREQHAAAMSYSWCHAMLYGRPWKQACLLGDRDGVEAPDELVEHAKTMMATMHALLTLRQQQAVANLAVFNFWPRWFRAAKLGLRELPADRIERDVLVSGLDKLARL
jgi:hypothetical protein